MASAHRNVEWLSPARAPGKYVAFELTAKHVYGMGLTYRGHADETASAAPGLEVFLKDPRALNRDGTIAIPSREAILDALEGVEAGLGAKVALRHREIPALLDYEVELGLLVLEPLGERALLGASPLPLGYFVASDVTARVVQILGEGRVDRMAYWGAAKSFPGFLVTGDKVWIPEGAPAESCIDVMIETRVNGIVRQRERTRELMYSPRQMLLAAARRAGGQLEAGDAVLTGTPAGVAFTVARWKRALADLLLSRDHKLTATILTGRRNPRFLRAGDALDTDGGSLGVQRALIVEGPR